MTFKHSTDTEIMRSLAKIANGKGWLPADKPVVKTAAPALDLSPTNNLTENLLKLCSGLRASGFDKQAVEVEQRFVTYKRAQSLYQAHKETGDDLLESAHPKGSHHLEGVEGKEATVEDLLDKHVQFLHVVNKQPIGKLSSSQDIIHAVKIILGQAITTPSLDKMSPSQLIASANQDLERVYQLAAKSGGMTGIVLGWIRGRMEQVEKLMTLPAELLSADNINDAINSVEAIERNMHPNFLHNYLPEFLNKGISTDALWNAITPILSSAKTKLQGATTKVVNLQTNYESPNAIGEKTVTELDAKTAPNANQQLIQSFNQIAQIAKTYKSRVAIRKLPNADALNNWLDSAIAESSQYANNLAKSGSEDAGLIADYTKEYNDEKAKLEAFRQRWLS
jgi:hypothetical protein